MVDDGRRTDDDGRRRTDDGPWLYYKLTNEPKGSGELKILNSDLKQGQLMTLTFSTQSVMYSFN